MVRCSSRLRHRAVRSGWPSQKSHAAKSARAPGVLALPARATAQERVGGQARAQALPIGPEVAIARPVGGDEVVEHVQDGLEALPGRAIGEGLGAKAGLQFGEAAVEASGLVERLARFSGAGVAFHEVAGGQGMEHLLFRGELDFDRVAGVGDLPAEGEASDAARGIALLVVGIEVNAARFVGPPHEGHGRVAGPLEGGDGVGVGRGIQVAGEQGGLSALRRSPQGHAWPARGGCPFDRQGGVPDLVELVEPGAAQVVFTGALGPVFQYQSRTALPIADRAPLIWMYLVPPGAPRKRKRRKFGGVLPRRRYGGHGAWGGER